MTPLAFDTETALIGVGRLAPPLTCVSWSTGQGQGVEWIGNGSCFSLVEGFLDDPGRLLVGLNVAYDCGVIAAEWPELMPVIFEAYADGRITDVGLRQKLIDIAHGQFRGYTDSLTEGHTKYVYSLAAMAERFFGKKRDKDTHRLGFGELRGVPLEEWPPGAAEYAVEDAVDTMEIFQIQEKNHAGILADQYRQARAAWGLHLISCWGIKTSAKKIAELEKSTEEIFQKALKACQDADLVRPNGKRDTKKARTRMIQVMEGLKESTKKTKAFITVRRKRDAGEELSKRELKNLDDPIFGISVDEEACDTSGDDLLRSYSQVTSLKTVVEKSIPQLKNGIHWPIQPTFDPLMETGRCSCKGYSDTKPTNGYQMHNVRRLPGIRECFTARDGKVFLDADFGGLELCTWAQNCLWALGQSKLAEALNSGTDPHLVLGCQIMGVTYDEIFKRYKANDEQAAEARQFAKIGNFGFQGGMSWKTFRAWARQAYRVNFSSEQAEHIQASWKATWPEAEHYFKWISAQCNIGDVGTITQFKSQRIRGLIPFTVMANTFFQGLGADATKAALFAVQRECYVDCGTALFGCRMVNYLHDEFMIEVPEDLVKANAAADRLVELMCEVANKWLPDVPVKAEALLMKHWSKKAKPVHNAAGQLIPWEMAA